MTVRSLSQLRNIPRPEWTWEGFILPKNFTLFSAYPKVGKTTLIFRMMKYLCMQQDFLDRSCLSVPILYISEEPDTLLAARADSLGFQDSWDIGWITHEPGLTWEKIIYYMKRWIYVKRNPLIIVDTLSRFWSASDENNATEVTHALNPVLEVIRNSEASFFGIHHNRKRGGGGGIAVRGSTALTGGVDVIMELSRTGDHDRSPVRRLQCESRYSETPGVLQIRLDGDSYTVEDSEALELEPQIIMFLQTIEGAALGDIVYMLAEPETTVRRVITGLFQRGVVTREGTGTSRSPYRYSLAVAAD